MNRKSLNHPVLRPFYIFAQPCLLGGCACGIYQLCHDGQLFAATPLVLFSLGLFRQSRWAMYWLSTPDEQALLGKYVERDPLRKVVTDWITAAIGYWRQKE